MPIIRVKNGKEKKDERIVSGCSALLLSASAFLFFVNSDHALGIYTAILSVALCSIYNTWRNP